MLCPLPQPHFYRLVNRDEGYIKCLVAFITTLHANDICDAAPTEVYNDASMRTA